MRVSFVIPAHNEAENLAPLLAELREALAALGGDGEFVVVDDASGDATRATLLELMAAEPRLRALHARVRVGQSAALAMGFAAATGEVIVTLDGDLQNDPRDAPRLVAALADADLACGVRIGRKDSRWKRITSRIAFRVRNAFLHDQARDTGCGLKAFRAPALAALVRFEGWHRFFPALARRERLRVVEVEVSHRARRHGSSKYGTLDRALRSLFDLAGMIWLCRRRLPPLADVEKLAPRS